jgi:putative ABC transport system substrate-binding protein
MYGKRLQLLKEAAPNIRRVVALIHEFKGHEGLTEVFVEHVKSAGKSLGIQIVLRNIDTPDDIEPAVADGVSDGADGLITTQGPFFRIHRRRLAAAAAAHRLPSITGETGYARAGGLMEYGPSIAGASRDCASLIHKILKGAKPADMPIAQPTKIKFTVNLKTSKALGLQLPRSILLRATEVIE